MTFRLIAATCLTAFITGCVTAEQLDDRLAGWRGADVDRLVELWGAPYGSYDRKDGSTLLSFGSSRVVSLGSTTMQRFESRSCRVDFKIDSLGAVMSSRWEGAVDQCDRLIRIAPPSGPVVKKEVAPDKGVESSLETQVNPEESSGNSDDQNAAESE